MMSSLRNSLHRRNHKERSQLTHRARFGILEKHKDYVLRARDYHSKQDRLTRLRQKAVERNKDEFYFGMNKQKTQGGVHVQDRGNIALPVDIVKVLKTQDENYLRTMRTAGLKKIEKLKSQISALADLVNPGLLDDSAEDVDGDLDEAELEILREASIIHGPSSARRRQSNGIRKGKHILFVETAEQARQIAFSSREKSNSEHDDSMDHAVQDNVDLGWKAPEQSRKVGKRRSQSNMQGNAGSAGLDKSKIEEDRREAAKYHRTRLLKELSARLFRDKQLRYAERELEMQRLLMGKGGARKLQGVEKVEGDDDQDEEDESNGRVSKKVDEKTWKPRVYKWRLERKR